MTVADRFGIVDGTRNVGFRGLGYFAGEAQDPDTPDGSDGLARILNVPQRLKVAVYEQGSMAVVASTVSAADGTWRIDYLHPDLYYTVIGFDGWGVQNAAIQDWVKPAPME